MYGLSFVLLSKRNKMAASFITQKGVIRRLPPVPKFSFYAIVFYKNEEGICLHVWNDVSSAIDKNLNAFKFTKVSSQLLKILILFLNEPGKFTPNVVFT